MTEPTATMPTGRRRGRPAADTAAAPTRERILAAAARLFAAQGYAATPVRAIAAAAGITEGAIYRHFSGKDALVDALLEEFRSRVYRPLPPPAAADGVAPGFTHGLLAGLPRVMAEDSLLADCAAFLLGEALHEGKTRDFVLATMVDGAEGFTQAMIEARRAEAGLPPAGDGARTAAVALNALRFGWLFARLILRRPGPDDAPRLAAEAAALGAFFDAALGLAPTAATAPSPTIPL